MSSPGQVSKLRVHRAGDHLCVDGLKLMHTITEGDDLSRTHKRAVDQHNQSNVQNNSLFLVFLLEVSSVHKGCIYLIKNTVKTVTL